MSDLDASATGSPLASLTLIANQLGEVVSQIKERGFQGENARTASLLDIVRRVMAERKALSQLSQEAVFTNGPWNMMLDLYESAWLQKPISVSSLAIASLLPPTTALRYIAYLEGSGLLTKDHDTRDGRRMLVTLTSQGFSQVTDHLILSARLWGIDISPALPPLEFA